MLMDVEVSQSAKRWKGTELRRCFGRFPSGVVAVVGLAAGVPRGMIVNSFTAVSLDPPLVSLCVAHTSSTWPILAKLPVLGLSVLAEHHEGVASALSARTNDKFANVDLQRTPSGAAFVRGSSLWLECAIVSEIRVGDHDVVVLKICDLRSHSAAPMIFLDSAYRRIVSAP